jgi:hypothetical protein
VSGVDEQLDDDDDVDPTGERRSIYNIHLTKLYKILYKVDKIYFKYIVRFVLILYYFYHYYYYYLKFFHRSIYSINITYI